MGYRSDVTLGVNKDCFEKHKTKELIDALQHCDIIRENDTQVFFEWQDVKWYPSYNEVIVVNDFISKLKKEEYGMIIVGEDDNDIERIGDTGEFELYVISHIQEPDGVIVDNKVFLAQKTNITDILVGK